MINNVADYRFVQGDINRVIINGDVMPVRAANNKRILRGEDLCFLAESHEARTNLWNGAVFKMSGLSYQDDPTDIQVYSPATIFNFTRNLSLTQLRTVANMSSIDSAKRAGSGSPQAISGFFLKQKPQSIYGALNTTILGQIQQQLGDMIQDTQIKMPQANLNGRVLKQSEIEDMFDDNALFRLYGCGNTDLNYGYGIGTTNQTSYVRYGDTSVIGNFAKHCIFHNVVISNTTTPKVLQEGCPDSNFVLASFNDDGDVNSAEYWGVFIFEYSPPNSSTIQRWLWLGKICDFQLAGNQWEAKQSDATWRSWFRQLWYDVCGVNLAASQSDIPSGTYNYSALTTLYSPFAIVTPKNRFIW